MDKKFDKFVDKMHKIACRAVRKAVNENRRLGVPNVFVKDGKIIYELPDKTITTLNPFTSKQ
ncbi:MAG: hypothetical protein ABIJ26_03665 [Candidatus Margulisiibacteriota bacterium]